MGDGDVHDSENISTNESLLIFIQKKFQKKKNRKTIFSHDNECSN
jgi:hypothetical protein